MSIAKPDQLPNKNRYLILMEFVILNYYEFDNKRIKLLPTKIS